MASGARTIRHLLRLTGVLCLASAASHGVVAQGARPDAVAIIQTFSDTGRIDYRFQSRDEALAFIKAWPAGVDRWVAAGQPAEGERRRHIAALAALEFVRTAFDGLAGAAGRDLFEALIDAEMRACAVSRPASSRGDGCVRSPRCCSLKRAVFSARRHRFSWPLRSAFHATRV